MVLQIRLVPSSGPLPTNVSVQVESDGVTVNEIFLAPVIRINHRMNNWFQLSSTTVEDTHMILRINTTEANMKRIMERNSMHIVNVLLHCIIS